MGVSVRVPTGSILAGAENTEAARGPHELDGFLRFECDPRLIQSHHPHWSHSWGGLSCERILLL